MTSSARTSLRRLPLWILSIFSLSAGFSALLLCGCDLSSGDETVRNVGADFSGFYMAPNSGPILSNQTGLSITSLNLRQNGDQLEAVDNNGNLHRGSIGRVNDTEASFTLVGLTTIGSQGTLTGSLSGEGTAGTLSGTWIEDGLFGTAYAVATISPIATNTPPDSTGDLTLDPTGTRNISVGTTQAFTASGGSGTYSWTLSNSSIGTLTSSSGSQVGYSASLVGTQTITVSDGSETQRATINQL